MVSEVKRDLYLKHFLAQFLSADFTQASTEAVGNHMFRCD